jgi:predicted NAD/FAD-dependent oxidoreductase
MCVLSKVSANCAPNNKSLISITVLGNPTENNQTLEEKVRQELVDWFGITTRQWQHLRTYRIKHALPNQSPANLAPLPPRQELREGLYVCGDHTSIGSINGALKSGRIVSELVAAKVRAIDYAHC